MRLLVLQFNTSVKYGDLRFSILENKYIKLCKQIIGIRQKSCNAAVCGKLGRYPLYINRYIRIVKYWLRITNTDNIILRTVPMNLNNTC